MEGGGLITLAHLVTTGLGPLYDGISHFLMSPEDSAVAFVAALFAGLRGPDASKRIMFILPVAWLLGGIIGENVNSFPNFPATGCVMLILGALAAADLKPNLTAISFVLGTAGLVQGWSNGASMNVRSGTTLALLGVSAAVFLVVTLVAGFVVALKPKWMRIAARVLGSWMAAVGLLLIGWFFRKH